MMIKSENINKEKIKKILYKALSNNLIILAGLFILIFLAYSKLFNSYFESDEWFYFTYYFPLTRQPYGFLNSILATIISANYISGGQHVVPIASLIYFLNTKFFGLNFVPYAFMSLFFHTINSFLVFLFLKTLLYKKAGFMQNTYSILGSFFFAISPVPMHAITGFAAFYGQNVLSVTFFILCLLFYKLAFIKKEKKLIYLSVVFVFLAVFTKESTTFIFLVLPLMTLLEKRIFSLKFLGKIYLICLTTYFIFRFLIPGIIILPEQLINSYISHSSSNQSGKITAESVNMVTVNFPNIPEINKNLLGELIFRSITFPIRMIGSIFLPSQTAFQIAQLIIPVIYPSIPGDSGVVQSAFTNYSGQSSFIYLLSIIIIIFCLKSVLKFKKLKRPDEAKSIIVGLSILALGALPLVPIIFTFPTWGYAIYFDSRHYYNPAVGAAILFPFLIFELSKFVAKFLNTRKIFLVTLTIFLLWFINNTYVFGKSIKLFTQNYSVERRESLRQLMHYLPSLKEKTVFYFDKDGQAPFGSLPFFTSVPQALTIAYYKSSPLPDSFFNKPLFSGNPEGYQFSQGRGFGYYLSKKNLSQDLSFGNFNIEDIYGFYYYGGTGKLNDITESIRKEMKDYIMLSKYEKKQ